MKIFIALPAITLEMMGHKLLEGVSKIYLVFNMCRKLFRCRVIIKFNIMYCCYSLCDNNIGERGAEILIEGLQCCSNLQYLM